MTEEERLLKLVHMAIPPGPYCYYSYKGPTCPFWDKDDSKPYQENGYCHYLQRGDWENNDEKEYINVKTGEKQTANQIGLPLSLLWDQCKECGINDDIDEDDYVLDSSEED